MEERTEGQRRRERPRQKLRVSMTKSGYWELKKNAQHREEWSRWTFGPSGRQTT